MVLPRGCVCTAVLRVCVAVSGGLTRCWLLSCAGAVVGGVFTVMGLVDGFVHQVCVACTTER